jgi:hypothetical protein
VTGWKPVLREGKKTEDTTRYGIATCNLGLGTWNSGTWN